ncbi:hypothetical protein [Providencia rettgeri]|uniref:hypothetical protein n=1 Tax=Providencia rettgeri TaxID=587 RepID=UPI0038503823
MDDVTHLGTITVRGNNPREYFNDYFNNYDNAHEDIDLTGRYEGLKNILHENLYDNKNIAHIHDDVDNHKVDTFQDSSTTIKDDLKSKQTLIKNDLITLRKDIAEIEKSPGWKFIIDPQKYPCTYKWNFQSSDSSKLKISATFKFRTIEDRDRLLAEDFDDNIPGIPRFPFDNLDLYIDAVNKRADRDARNQLLEIKKQHKSITDKIQFNVNELNKLKIAQSSVFAVPTPNVPTLPHGVGSNSQVTQTANSNIVKGIEKTLGNIRDGLAETFDCSFGMSCSNDIDKAAKNPNVGKPHTGGDQIPEQGRIDTGGNQIPEQGKIDTGGNQLPEPIEKLPGTSILDTLSIDNLAYLDKITQGEHAGIRNKEGRPVSSVINDVQKSRPSDILIQDDGRWVVKGNGGRIHLIEPDGEVVSSFKNSDKNTAQRTRDGRWNRPSNEKLDEFKEKFSDYVRW